MMWKEIKSWAKKNGYNIIKGDISYDWVLDKDNNIKGSAPSVSKVARSIYNHMTNNKFIEYQNKYISDKQDANIKNDLF